MQVPMFGGWWCLRNKSWHLHLYNFIAELAAATNVAELEGVNAGCWSLSLLWREDVSPTDEETRRCNDSCAKLVPGANSSRPSVRIFSQGC